MYQASQLIEVLRQSEANPKTKTRAHMVFTPYIPVPAVTESQLSNRYPGAFEKMASRIGDLGG